MITTEASTGPSIRVCSLDELEQSRFRVISAGGHTVLVLLEQGQVYALDNRCPHMGFPLHRGTVKDGILTCHWHHAKFDLAGGCTLDPFADDVPAFRPEVRERRHLYRPAAYRPGPQRSLDGEAGRRVGAKHPPRPRKERHWSRRARRFERRPPHDCAFRPQEPRCWVEQRSLDPHRNGQRPAPARPGGPQARALPGRRPRRQLHAGPGARLRPGSVGDERNAAGALPRVVPALRR